VEEVVAVRGFFYLCLLSVVFSSMAA